MFSISTELHPEKDDQEYVVEFDFLGKDSIRYTNNVPVEKRVSSSSSTLIVIKTRKTSIPM